VTLTVIALVRSAGADGPPSRAEQARQIAAGLRCPTCQGLSVADSTSPLAQSMREIIDVQLAAGAGADQVRGYFVARYGDWVLLAPPADHLGWVIWTVPVIVVLGGLAAAGATLTRRALPPAARWSGLGLAAAGALAVMLGATLGPRGTGDLPTGTPPGGQSTVAAVASPAAQSDLEQRLQVLRAAVEQRPGDLGTRLALASVALQLGRTDMARGQAAAVLDQDPDNVDALLLRGISPDGPGDPDAVAALRRFLELAPADHPGVPLARAATTGGSSP
jgi:cytochrome c-type biogenesis protein CcmH/NrfF